MRNNTPPQEAGRSRSVRPRTAKQIAASRANGAKSRGPRTEAGKERSSANAVQHGLFAQKFVPHASPRAEDLEYRQLVAALRDQLRPKTAMAGLNLLNLAHPELAMRRLASVREALFKASAPASPRPAAHAVELVLDALREVMAAVAERRPADLTSDARAKAFEVLSEEAALWAESIQSYRRFKAAQPAKTDHAATAEPSQPPLCPSQSEAPPNVDASVQNGETPSSPESNDLTDDLDCWDEYEVERLLPFLPLEPELGRFGSDGFLSAVVEGKAPALGKQSDLFLLFVGKALEILQQQNHEKLKEIASWDATDRAALLTAMRHNRRLLQAIERAESHHFRMIERVMKMMGLA